MNAGGEIFYNTPGNWEIPRRIMVDNRIDKKYWTVSTMWVQAIVGARADGTLQTRPDEGGTESHARSARQSSRKRCLTQERNRVAGRKATPCRRCFRNSTAPSKGWKNAAPTTEAKVTLPTVEKSYEEMDDSEKLAYRKLKPEHMRMWLRNRARYVHETTYPNPNA